MESVGEKRLKSFLAQYVDREVDDAYLTLYDDSGDTARVFASLHERLDREFDWMNTKARNGRSGHFNAENSRALLDVIDEVDELYKSLEKAGRSVELSPEYHRVLTGSRVWLEPSGGSPIPEGFTPVDVDKYEPAFTLGDAAVVLPNHSKAKLTVVGEGAYAMVHKFTDPNYDITIARKKLKRGADEEAVDRFRREFDTMKSLDFPYILPVYRFSDNDSSYTMEYCQSTLLDYIKRRNNQPEFNFALRKRLALQFLYGVNFLHLKEIFHRDLSYKNVLIREYPEGPFTVKLSDFGLAKLVESDLTRSGAEIYGTIVDPALEKFKSFEPVNDVYAIGFVLSYIFSGTRSLIPDGSPQGNIVHKCSHSDPSKRYQKVQEIISAVEKLEG
ncbi:protein kinase family protein [Rhodococcus fascians]|nr:protein kinase family protein [Rhodococcus fascians]MBY4397685.1 protein kinase family protein [Rhodococcus fascians]MBY4406685.1 protein kinase family protein [Rhodococcus fascians]MBY4422456.1 protein kinase family protein [Rhodococcus fascians]MBY4461951.1 protein kinase family protein [Rhodococcus fascians]